MPLAHPRLVCISEKCLQSTHSSNEKKMISYIKCEENSYLNGVMQEAINDSRIVRCANIDTQTGKHFNSLNDEKVKDDS